MRVRSDLPALASQVHRVYANFPLRANGAWAELHLDLRRAPGWRGVIRPQVRFACDGQQPFEPFPADSPLPLLEWGANWLIGRRMNHVLLLHAGVLERDGLALVMPAIPGSGKSTLTSALSLSGWRLLSDEFGAFEPNGQVFLPVLKPAALKNSSIDVVRHFSGRAKLGPSFPKTRKGTVAHLLPSAEAVARVHDTAQPGAIVFPRWQEGSPTRWDPLTPSEVFAELAFNAFNYNLLGVAGFRSVVLLARACPAWRLTYSRLEEAIPLLAQVWPEVVAGSAPRRSEAQAAAAQDL
jgi:HprK-related kinase A